MAKAIVGTTEDVESTSRLVQIFDVLQSLPVAEMCDNDDDFPIILHEIQVFLLKCYAVIGRRVSTLAEKAAAERNRLKRLCGLRRLEIDRMKESTEDSANRANAVRASENLQAAGALVGAARGEYRRKR